MKLYALLCTLAVLSASAQQNPKVDFKTIHAQIEINPVKRNVTGICNYTFEVHDKSIDTIRIDAQKMEFANLKINGAKANFKASAKELLLYEGFKKGKNTLTFTYEAFPTQTMYFVNWDFAKENTKPEDLNGQIWTQGQGKFTSHWLPSFDDTNEKVVFSLDILFEKSFEVVSNGELVNKKPQGENNLWQYRMKSPMSSYLAMVAIGHYDKMQFSAQSGVPNYLYFEPQEKALAAISYKNSKEIFDFLEKEIEVPYAWEVYRQVPLRDFLYAGMENTAATTFSQDYMVDAIGYNDRKYSNVNAHELAHQWFGDLVTAKTGKDHWLQEGFATYYALLAEQHLYGDDFFYNALYNNAQQLNQAAKTDLVPMYNEKASSLTYYQKGAWALHAIRSQIGAEKFRLAVKNYLKKYAFQNVSSDDFLNEVKAVATFDIAQFKKDWLEQAGFDMPWAEQLLRGQSKFLEGYFELRDKRLTLPRDEVKMIDVMRAPVYYPQKVLLLYQILEQPFEEKVPVLRVALKTGDVQVRQAVASSVESIPESFRADYESLLDDPSYETREIALFNLWKVFPHERARYLEKSKDWVGFQNKNLRLLWLDLSYRSTEDKVTRLKLYQELVSYTGTNYDSALQQGALERLIGLDLKSEDVMRSLAYGLGNHRWQFVKFCRDQIRESLKTKKYRDMLIKIRPELPIREKTQLQRLLAE